MSTNLTQYFNGPFDATSVELPTGGGVFSVGRHVVKIVEAMVDSTKAGNGGLIKLELEAIDHNDPDFGRTMAYRINLFNPNEMAKKIAAQQFAALCLAVQVPVVQDLAQLYNIPFVVEVVNQKLTAEQQAKKDAGENVEPYKEIKRVYDVNGNEPGKTVVQPAQTANHQAQQQQGAQWGGQQQQTQQPAQQAQQTQQPQWGNQQQAAQQTQQNNAPAWGNNAGGQQQTQQANNAPAWGNQAQSNTPAWGQKS